MTVGPESYKEGLSRFASGITVITTTDGGEPHGMTATAFASVSLDPPLVSVSLEKTSQTREIASTARVFTVNILSDGQEELSRTFATKGDKPFERIGYAPGENGCPRLEGATAWIECTVEEMIDAGDHDVVIGLVTTIELGDGDPLVYYRRAYRRLANP